MKLLRFNKDGVSRYGIINGEDVIVINQKGDVEGANPVFKLKDIEILPPSLPSKIIAIGVNYRDHAEEMGKEIPEEPLIFLKPGTAVIGHNDDIVHPDTSKRVDYEAELAIVIGKRAHRVSYEDAKDHILGYTCFNDVTARDLQKKDVQYTRAKGFDTFAPVGPWIETEIDPTDLVVESYLNGLLKQSSSTANLIFDPYYLVSFISHVMTLLPGDIISTGTPSGVGPMKPGDEIEIRIKGIGSLVNRVVECKR